MNQPARLAVFLSGNGSNAEAIFSYYKNHPSIQVVLVLSNNPAAFGLQRASKFNIPSRVFTRQQFRESDEVVQWLKEAHVTHVVLAGFLWLIPLNLIHEYPHRIINIHPALLPKYGGKGMYGMKVHQTVLDNKEKETGITIHYVNEHYDEGEFIFQQKVTIEDCASAEEIASKVQQLEHDYFPQTIEKLLNPKS